MPVSTYRESSSSAVLSTSSFTTTSSISNSPVLWNPRSVFQIQDDCRCVGWAPSKGRKCLNPISQNNRSRFDDALYTLSTYQPCPDTLYSTMKRLATYGLCIRYHQGQASNMVKKWTGLMMERFPEGVVERGSPRRLDNGGSSSGVSRRPTPSTSSTLSASLSARAKIEELEDIIRSLRESLEIDQPPQARTDYSQRTTEARRRRSPSPTRVSTPDISPLRLSSSLTSNSRSNATSTRNSAPAAERPSTTRAPAPTPAPAPAPTPARTPAQPVATRSLPTPRPSTSATRCSKSHSHRKALDEECAICRNDSLMSTSTASDLVWCKNSCGRSVHRECFETWRSQCEKDGKVVNCIICRAEWQKEECACN